MGLNFKLDGDTFEDLDPEIRFSSFNKMAFVERINRELGTLAVIITHNAVMADMADRVIHFSDGRVQHIRTNPHRAKPESLKW